MLLFPHAVSTVSVRVLIADLAHDDTVDAVLILIFIAASSNFRSRNSCSSVNVSICLVLILF